MRGDVFFSFVFFHDTATTQIYTLSLHDALPIYHRQANPAALRLRREIQIEDPLQVLRRNADAGRSEEHTSELQSLTNLVCRLLLEKKKNTTVDTAQSNDTLRKVDRSDQHCTKNT